MIYLRRIVRWECLFVISPVKKDDKPALFFNVYTKESNLKTAENIRLFLEFCFNRFWDCARDTFTCMLFVSRPLCSITKSLPESYTTSSIQQACPISETYDISEELQNRAAQSSNI